jgi:hypothetical protein
MAMVDVGEGGGSSGGKRHQQQQGSFDAPKRWQKVRTGVKRLFFLGALYSDTLFPVFVGSGARF